MDCRRTEELLSALLDGELACEERLALETHLEACPECRALHAELEAVVHASAALPRFTTPAGFTSAVIERLRPAEEMFRPIRRELKAQRTLRPNLAIRFATAASFLVFAALVYMSFIALGGEFDVTPQTPVASEKPAGETDTANATDDGDKIHDNRSVEPVDDDESILELSGAGGAGGVANAGGGMHVRGGGGRAIRNPDEVCDEDPENAVAENCPEPEPAPEPLEDPGNPVEDSIPMEPDAPAPSDMGPGSGYGGGVWGEDTGEWRPVSGFSELADASARLADAETDDDELEERSESLRERLTELESGEASACTKSTGEVVVMSTDLARDYARLTREIAEIRHEIRRQQRQRNLSGGEGSSEPIPPGEPGGNAVHDGDGDESRFGADETRNSDGVGYEPSERALCLTLTPEEVPVVLELISSLWEDVEISGELGRYTIESEQDRASQGRALPTPESATNFARPAGEPRPLRIIITVAEDD